MLIITEKTIKLSEVVIQIREMSNYLRFEGRPVCFSFYLAISRGTFSKYSGYTRISHLNVLSFAPQCNVYLERHLKLTLGNPVLPMISF